MISLFKAYKKNDPALRSFLEFLLYPGIHALFFHRIAHPLYKVHLYFLARFISQWSRFFTGIEIHPGARIGKRLVIDHGMGIVIGEQSIIGDDCLLYHGVTLGSKDNKSIRRHPELKDHVLVGAHAQLLGGITVGSHAVIGANSVVTKDVEEKTVVAGNPARFIKHIESSTE